VRCDAVNNSPTGNWTFRIETDSGGVASGTLVNANATVSVTPVAAGNTAKGYFPVPISLSAATTYWLVVSAADQVTGANWRLSMNNTSSYANGAIAYSIDGAAWTTQTRDLYFKIYGACALQSYSESTIKTQGSYSLKVLAVITDSLNKTLTKTFSTNHNLTGVKNLRFDAYALRTGGQWKLGLHDTGGTTTEITPTIATSNTWQPVNFDLSAVADANKDAIDTAILTITNADSANIINIDYWEISQAIDVFGMVD
jgi:hypothetical protein